MDHRPEGPERAFFEIRSRRPAAAARDWRGTGAPVGQVRAGLAALQMRGFRYPELCRAQLDRRLRRGSRQTPEDRLHAHECCGSPVHPGAGPILLDIRAASYRYRCCNCCCCASPSAASRLTVDVPARPPPFDRRTSRGRGGSMLMAYATAGLCDGGVVVCEAGGRCRARRGRRGQRRRRRSWRCRDRSEGSAGGSRRKGRLLCWREGGAREEGPSEVTGQVYCMEKRLHVKKARPHKTPCKPRLRALYIL